MPKTVRHQNKDGSIWYHRREKLGTWQWWTLKPEPFSWINPELEKRGGDVKPSKFPLSEVNSKWTQRS